jgi:hypothetical protein
LRKLPWRPARLACRRLKRLAASFFQADSGMRRPKPVHRQRHAGCEDRRRSCWELDARLASRVGTRPAAAPIAAAIWRRRVTATAGRQSGSLAVLSRRTN